MKCVKCEKNRGKISLEKSQDESWIPVCDNITAVWFVYSFMQQVSNLMTSFDKLYLYLIVIHVIKISQKYLKHYILNDFLNFHLN